MTPKTIHKIFIPQKIFIFLKTHKNFEIQNFEPKKWPEPTYAWKYQSIPPLWAIPATRRYHASHRVKTSPFVKSAYQLKLSFLISQPNHLLWRSKESSYWDGYFETQNKCKLKLRILKNICSILRFKIVFKVTNLQMIPFIIIAIRYRDGNPNSKRRPQNY